jgi:hypothetical protein
LITSAVLILGACASGAHHTLQELDRMPIIHQPPPAGIELGTQQDKGTFVGRQAGILTIYATPMATDAIAHYYKAAYPSYHFVPDSSPPSGTYSMVGSHRYSGGTANVFVRIRTGSPWIEDGYTLNPRPSSRAATNFVTVLLLGVPD